MVIFMYMRLFFFNHPATTENYTLPYTTLFRSRNQLSLEHRKQVETPEPGAQSFAPRRGSELAILVTDTKVAEPRSEEHTSELQSPYDLVCRLLLEKKNVIRLRMILLLITYSNA